MMGSIFAGKVPGYPAEEQPQEVVQTVVTRTDAVNSGIVEGGRKDLNHMFPQASDEFPSDVFNKNGARNKVQNLMGMGNGSPNTNKAYLLKGGNWVNDMFSTKSKKKNMDVSNMLGGTDGKAKNMLSMGGSGSNMVDNILGVGKGKKDNFTGKIDSFLGLSSGKKDKSTGKIDSFLGLSSGKNPMDNILGKTKGKNPMDKYLGFGASKNPIENMLGMKSGKNPIEKMLGTPKGKNPINKILGLSLKSNIVVPNIYGVEKNARANMFTNVGQVGLKRMKAQKGLNPMGDFDGDGVLNALDCEPLNRKKQGPLEFAKSAWKGFKGEDYSEDENIQAETVEESADIFFAEAPVSGAMEATAAGIEGAGKAGSFTGEILYETAEGIADAGAPIVSGAKTVGATFIELGQDAAPSLMSGVAKTGQYFKQGATNVGRGLKSVLGYGVEPAMGERTLTFGGVVDPGSSATAKFNLVEQMKAERQLTAPQKKARETLAMDMLKYNRGLRETQVAGEYSPTALAATEKARGLIESERIKARAKVAVAEAGGDDTGGVLGKGKTATSTRKFLQQLTKGAGGFAQGPTEAQQAQLSSAKYDALIGGTGSGRGVYEAVAPTGASFSGKVAELVGPSREQREMMMQQQEQQQMAPPTPQQVPTGPTQQAQRSPGVDVYSPYTNKKVSYVRGPYRKRPRG